MGFNNTENMYRYLYDLFDGVTPLETDCGVLCSAACCKGDGNTGMLLFPNEQTTLAVKNSDEGRVAVCEGKCGRSERPLSCRIFPFFPFIDGGEIEVRIDSRAEIICPLARNYKNVKFDPLFIRRVRVAGRILAKDKECRDFLIEITKQAQEIDLLKKRIDI